MTFMRFDLVAVVTSLGLMASCSYGSSTPEPESPSTTEVTPPPKEESAPAPPPAEEAPPSPPTGACDDRACSVDQDCCKGYGCALDPERSRVQRYCLAE
jgi:hypothetical protein